MKTIVMKQQDFHASGKEPLLCLEEGTPMDNVKGVSMSGKKKPAKANLLELAAELFVILGLASCLWAGHAHVVVVAGLFTCVMAKAKKYHGESRDKHPKSYSYKIPLVIKDSSFCSSEGISQISKEPAEEAQPEAADDEKKPLSLEEASAAPSDALASSSNEGNRKRKRFSFGKQEDIPMSQNDVSECLEDKEQYEDDDEGGIGDDSEFSYDEEDNAFTSSFVSGGGTPISEDGTVEAEGESPLQTHHVIAHKLVDPYGERGTYTGSLSNDTDMPHGSGRLDYGSGRWYDGEWSRGRWSGKGRLSNGERDLYDGEFLSDQKHGNGTMRFADGRVFVGSYINGQMNDGKMTYQDGSTYQGSWATGMRHGHGKCVFTDGSFYEGEFREGEFHGQGTMTWADGGYYEGEWWNGEMQGQGKEVRPDGTLRHEGRWSRGSPLRNNRGRW